LFAKLKKQKTFKSDDKTGNPSLTLLAFPRHLKNHRQSCNQKLGSSACQRENKQLEENDFRKKERRREGVGANK